MGFIKKSKLLVLMPILTSLLFITIWHIRDRGYPLVDSSHMFTLTQEIYTIAKDSTYTQALEFALTHKHWRPLLFPVLVSPLMWITGGSFFWMFKILTLLMALITLYWLVRVCVLLTQDVYARVLQISVVVLSGAFFTAYTNLGSEAFYVATSLATFYYWYKSYYIGVGHRGFCIAWFFALTSRPAEALILFLPFFISLVVKDHKRIKFSKKSLVLFLIFIFSGVGILSNQFLNVTRGEYTLKTAVLMTTVFYILLFLASHFLKWKDNLNLFIKWAFLPCFFWYSTGMLTLISWILPTTLGDMAKSSYDLSNVGYWGFWVEFVKFYGVFPCAVMFAGFLLSFFKKQTLIFVALMAIIFLGSFSYNWDMRYYYPNVFLMLVLSAKHLMELLSDKHFAIKLSTAITPFVMAVSPMAYSIGNPAVELDSFEQYAGGAPSWIRFPRQAITLHRITDQLVEWIPNYATSVAIFWGAEAEGLEAINPWTLQLRTHDLGRRWIFRGFEAVDNEIYRDTLLRSEYVVVRLPREDEPQNENNIAFLDSDPNLVKLKGVDAESNFEVRGLKFNVYRSLLFRPTRENLLYE